MWLISNYPNDGTTVAEPRAGDWDDRQVYIGVPGEGKFFSLSSSSKKKKIRLRTDQ